MKSSRLVLALGAAGCAVCLTACANSATSAGASAPASPGSSASASASAPASPSSSPTASASAEPTERLAACPESRLSITLTHTGALGGQAGGYLTFTNKGTSGCQISGWPRVTGVSKTGASGTLAHARSTMYGAWRYSAPQPIVYLAPGESAYAVVAADDNPAGSASRCPSPYTQLRVTPPAGTTATAVSAYLPGADTYLPTCASIYGKATDEISDIVPLSRLAH